MSSYHFGEEHLGEKIAVNSIFNFFYYISYGVFIFSMLFYESTANVDEIMRELTNTTFTKLQIKFSLILSSFILLVMSLYLVLKKIVDVKKLLKEIFYLGLLFLVILMLAYSNHFNNDFHFDDSHTIVNNVHIRKLSNIPKFFTNPQMFSASPAHWGLRPVVTTTLAIDYWIAGGLKPFYFHLSTFLWHILLCVLLFFVYKKLLSNTLQSKWINYAGILAAGWFAIHTANAETLNYIISRSDVISTFCIVASFAIYLLFPAKRKYFFYLIPAMLGVFAKETILVLVMILFFYKWLFEKEFSIVGLFKKKNLKTFYPLALVRPSPCNVCFK